MESLIGLVIVVALAVPVLAVAALVVALTSRGRIETLERKIEALQRELARRPAMPPAAAAVRTEQAPATTPVAPERAAAPVETAATTAAPPPPPPPYLTRPATPRVPPRAAEPKRSLEERLGARWSVIVGGLALAFGGVFLVRYSIEQGWIGPAARIAAGAIFSAALLVLGERMRRAEAKSEGARKPIDIPAVVTSAGAVSAFATIYAAYAVYAFVGPLVAFPLLGLVAVATLLAAALHGPILGAIGIVGAYAVPALVSSDQPNAWALFTYLLAPTAAAFAVGRLRGWPPIALAAGVLAFVWGFAATAPEIDDAGALLAYAFGLTALGTLFHTGLERPKPPAAFPDVISSVLIALYGVLGALAVPIGDFGSGALIGAGLLFSAHLMIGMLAGGLAPVAAVGGALAALVALAFSSDALSAIADVTNLPPPGETARPEGVTDFLSFVGVIGAIYLIGGTFAVRSRPAKPDWWQGLLAAATAATPLLMVAVAYWRISSFEPDLRFATIAVLLAGALAFLTEDSAKREASGAASPAATAAFATGAAAALGLALAMAMREGALTVALSFLAAALGFVATARPIKALGWLALAAAGLVAARIALDPKIVGDGLGTTPIFNALLWGYGAPAVAFWAGSIAFRRAGQQLPAQALEALSLVFALLLGAMEARHFAHDGRLEAEGGVSLLEAGLDATLTFGLAAAASRLGLSRASPVLGYGALAASALGLALSVFGLLLLANPYFTGEPVGTGLIFNDLTVGYLVPAIAALAAAKFVGEGRPVWFRRALGSAGVVLSLAWATLMTRRAFVGEALDGFSMGDGEWYAYSAVWLAFGLALLAVGFIRRSQMLRLASAIISIAVVFKVFLLDMSGLGGMYRALSFIGLGGVLVGIGLIYQRLLFPRRAAA